MVRYFYITPYIYQIVAIRLADYDQVILLRVHAMEAL